MSLVWYTTAELADGVIVNTNDYCHLNRQALSRASAAERAVEDLLSQVRDREFPKAPRRICAFVTVPWPSKKASYQGEGIRFIKGVKYEAIPEPAGEGTYCYRVAPGPKGERWMVDEGIVADLVENWDRISEDQALEMAAAYWEGQIWHSIFYLLSGDVRILRRCDYPTFR